MELGALQFESTYDRPVKIMANLPLQTHRYLIVPISDLRQMKLKIIKYFLNFINSIRNSAKHVLRQLLSLSKDDVRTTTGQNPRNILLLTNKQHVDDMHPGLVDGIEYHHIEEVWRINIVKEITDLGMAFLKLMKAGHLNKGSTDTGYSYRYRYQVPIYRYRYE